MPSWTPDRPVATGDGVNDVCPASRRTGDEWLWGWDPTPGIVSVWADHDGRTLVWRRMTETDELVLEQARFRPWLLLTGSMICGTLAAGLGRKKQRARW
jgi:hypothetical protein